MALATQYRPEFEMFGVLDYDKQVSMHKKPSTTRIQHVP